MRADLVGGLEAPCWVCDLDRARAKYQAILGAFRGRFDDVVVAYSYKTNWLPALCATLHREGAWAEVVSALEYRLAERLGVPPGRIVFNGTGRTYEELAPALAGGAVVNLDSLEEAEAVARWAREHPGSSADVGLRLAVAVPDEVQGRPLSRFGLSAEAGELQDAVRILGAAPGVRIVGLHAHLSSKARSLEVFRGIARALARGAGAVPSEPLRYVDIGGGLGFAPDAVATLDFPDFAAYASAVADVLDEEGFSMEGRRLYVEPGIALVGDCFGYLADVLALKRRPGRTVAVIGASIQTVKPARHRHPLPTLVLDGEGRPRTGDEEPYDLVGYTCMEDDYVGLDQRLPRLRVGDRLLIGNVGAYTMVFKPRFIRGMPPVHVIDGGGVRLAARAETVDDFLDVHRVPEGAHPPESVSPG